MTRFNREDPRTVLPQLSDLIDKLYEKIGKTYILDTYNPTNYSFTANQYRNIQITCKVRDGYTPIIVACVCYSHSAIRVFNYYISGDTLSFEAVNTSSSSISSANFTVQVLNLKTELSQ